MLRFVGREMAIYGGVVSVDNSRDLAAFEISRLKISFYTTLCLAFLTIVFPYSSNNYEGNLNMLFILSSLYFVFSFQDYLLGYSVSIFWKNLWTQPLSYVLLPAYSFWV